jgi:tetratricopeptide (TPR) repeat protein
MRPHAVIQSENFMQQGIKAFQQDNFLQAINSFNKALVLYQSIDEQNGILLARINLIESALAISRFDLAEQNFALIGNTERLPPALSSKIILLKAHELFLQEHYHDALKTLDPLLAQLPDTYKEPDSGQINLLLTKTKFAIFAHSADANSWFKRLDAVMAENSTINLKQKALFKRLSAHITQQKNNQEQAITLMQQAIDLYKSKANRRAIATCLQEIAQFYYTRQNYIAAHESLNRSLLIRKWLKDTYKTTVLDQQLQLLDSEAVLTDLKPM